MIDTEQYPTISIITPSFNQGKYIEETIESVISQGYPNLEYIVIDGGSSDETVDIIKKYEKYITYWVSEKDQGQAHAINKGFNLSNGDICTWINSDDLIYKDAFWKVAKYFSEDLDLEFIHGRGIYFNDKGNKWPADKNLDNLEIRYITHFCYDLQPSTYYRRRIFDRIGYLDESYILQMDAEFFMRIGLNCNIMKVDDLLSKFREHDLRKSNISQNADLVEKEFFRRYSKVLRSFSFSKDFIRDAKKLNVYCDGNEGYPVSKRIDRSQLEKSFCIYLVTVAEGKYLRGDHVGMKSVINYLRNYYGQILETDIELSEIVRRLVISQIFPLSLIKKIKSYWIPRMSISL